MVFNSLTFALFLPVVLGLYWLVRTRVRQNGLLLVASYVFYGAWDYRFLGLMMLSTVTDFTVGRLLGSTDDERRRKRILMVSIAVNLGILGFFKYFNFFADSAVAFLHRFGLQADAPTLRVLLPVGISFYTFHGMSYTFDVYRRHIEPERSPLNFALFIAYFPQLVAGPIGRAQIQLPQFTQDRRPPTSQSFRSGLFLILLGLFKKVAIADALAPYVNDVFAQAGSAGAGQLLIGMFGFAFQIYADFSGYSDIARGSSRLFGIELLRNFDQPFLSRNITELWRAWHISLTTWLRDYLYFPLGGNRRGARRTYLNIMIVFLVAGLWHGAAWTFVAWGAINGVFLVVHRWLGGRRREATGLLGDPSSVRGAPAAPPSGAAAQTDVRAPGTTAAPRFGRRDALPAFGTFILFSFAFVFFRANSFRQAAELFRGILTFRAGPLDRNALILLVYAAIAVSTIDIVQRNGRDDTAMLSWAPVARGVVFATFAVAVLVFSGGTPVPFIYFQF